jgi:hypothetical protein
MNKLSLFAYILSAALLAYSNLFYYPKYNQPRAEATIGWDVSGYYWYLPAFFIYQDGKQLAFSEAILKKYNPTPDYQQAFLHHSGSYVIKYPCGLAIQMLPAFLLAHHTADFYGYEQDGFSLPYQIAIQLNGLFWALIGFWLLRKLLLYEYKDNNVAVVLLLFSFGSNYLNYSAIDSAAGLVLYFDAA